MDVLPIIFPDERASSKNMLLENNTLSGSTKDSYRIDPAQAGTYHDHSFIENNNNIINFGQSPVSSPLSSSDSAETENVSYRNANNSKKNGQYKLHIKCDKNKMNPKKTNQIDSNHYYKSNTHKNQNDIVVKDGKMLIQPE